MYKLYVIIDLRVSTSSTWLLAGSARPSSNRVSLNVSRRMAVADAMPSGELEVQKVQKVQKHKDCQDYFPN